MWEFDRLPYAKQILLVTDIMHSFGNVIRDYVNSLRPTQSGVRGMSAHQNRTYTDAVRLGCEQFKIMRPIWSEASGPPAWIIDTNQLIEGDNSMKRICGQVTNEERPLNILKKGKYRTTHGLIFWATRYARHSLSHVIGTSKPYVDHMLLLFEILAYIASNRFDKRWIRASDGSNGIVREQLVAACHRRSGSFPPSESTITLHELIHCLDQILDGGPNRYLSMYKFERMNLVLKVIKYPY